MSGDSSGSELQQADGLDAPPAGSHGNRGPAYAGSAWSMRARWTAREGPVRCTWWVWIWRNECSLVMVSIGAVMWIAAVAACHVPAWRTCQAVETGERWSEPRFPPAGPDARRALGGRASADAASGFAVARSVTGPCPVRARSVRAALRAGRPMRPLAGWRTRRARMTGLRPGRSDGYRPLPMGPRRAAAPRSGAAVARA